jgi:hypothetical protein
MGGFENRQVVSYQNLDELHAKFYSARHHFATNVVQIAYEGE